jgi:y4mF family transcriptional regulator
MNPDSSVPRLRGPSGQEAFLGENLLMPAKTRQYLPVRTFLATQTPPKAHISQFLPERAFLPLHTLQGSIKVGYLPVREIAMTHKPNPPQPLTPTLLGESVRLARKSQGLLQEELAGVAGVGTRFIVELEAGKPTLQLDKVLAVLGTLGLILRLEPKNEAQAIHWAPQASLTPNANVSVSRSSTVQVGRPSSKKTNQNSVPIEPQKTAAVTRISGSRTKKKTHR